MDEELDTTCLWSSDAFTDVEIRICARWGSTQSVKVHKAILYSRLSKFREIIDKVQLPGEIATDPDTKEIMLSPVEFGLTVAPPTTATQSLKSFVQAIYTGSFDIDNTTSLHTIIGLYVIGNVTGTPILQQAAATNCRRIFSSFSEKVDDQEVLGVENLKRLVFILYGQPRGRFFPLDKEVDKHGLRDYLSRTGFPLIHEYLKKDELEGYIRKYPDFAVDYAFFLGSKLQELRASSKREEGAQLNL
ncbi:hypothetical protein HDK64DRAFT_255914 [Phyllosticta capitalensis]